MPNQIDQNGIQIQTHAEIIDELLNGATGYPGMYQIYGSDISVLPNSPDGQMLNIIAQAKLDMLEFIQQVYTSFDPDQAIGTQLDQRCAINGVVRQPGAKTLVNITVTFTATTTLVGLDGVSGVFQVQDAAGNTYSLVSSITHVAGSVALPFQANQFGPLNPTLNTVTIITTPTLGVSTVTNAVAPTSVGTTEESDYSLRIRRARSVANPSRGYLEGLWGALTDLAGVTSVLVLENDTGSTDGNGIPGHSIWCVVAGGTDADVAQAIYVHRNAGCGMKGSTTVNITQVDATTFVVAFNRPTPENLYIKATLTPITGSVDLTYVKAQILALLSYQINQQADASAIVTLIRQIAPNVSVSACNVSNDGATWVSLLAVTAVNYQWALSGARITLS